MRAPLLNKRIRVLDHPRITLALCEVANGVPRYESSAMLFQNRQAGDSAPVVLGGGIFDSHFGSDCASFVSSFLKRALELHHADISTLMRIKQQIGQQDALAPALETILARKRQQIPRSAPTVHQRALEVADVCAYAAAADLAFLVRCSNEHDVERRRRLMQVGCRAAWCSAVPSDADDSVEVCAANVGDARAFGIASSQSAAVPEPSRIDSLFDPRKVRIVQMSVDHTTARKEEAVRVINAGGTINSANLIDGLPTMNVTRAFGHHCLKSDPRIPLISQKVINTPFVKPHRLYPGDMFVLANYGVFETRSGDPTTLDELAEVVKAHCASCTSAPAVAAASAAVDYAVSLGAQRSLQVMVGVVQSGSPAAALSAAQSREMVDPGPVYPAACRASAERLRALSDDAQRCGLSVAELLHRRFDKISAALAQVPATQMHDALLADAYPLEWGVLERVLHEERDFFFVHQGKHRDEAFFESLAASMEASVVQQLRELRQ